MTVSVRGTVVRSLPPGTSLATLVAREHLRPRRGSLLDVAGGLLRRGLYPGYVAVNGKKAPGTRRLQPGDLVAVVNGKDRTERTEQVVYQIDGGRVSNPQRYLGTAPGEQIVTEGELSHKVVSSVFRATGPVNAPLQVALTFDDGPNPTYTPQVLDVLRRMHVKATFFMVGNLVERYPSVARQVSAAGMTIGSLQEKQIVDEIAGCVKALAAVGVQPHFFRPPGGTWNPFVIQAASARGMRTVLWAIDTRDYARPPAGTLVQSILAQARPGSIVLLHDGGGDRSNTVAALPGIINGLRKMGLEPVALT